MTDRKFPPMPRDGSLESWALTRETSEPVAYAIRHVASGHAGVRVAPAFALEFVWSEPTPEEYAQVVECLKEWARFGDIEPGAYFWGWESLDI